MSDEKWMARKYYPCDVPDVNVADDEMKADFGIDESKVPGHTN